MNRLELLEKIEAVEPAIAAKQTIPILAHLWFTGRHIMAYNDGIAISATMRTDFKAAVPTLLIKLLRASMATEIDISLKQNGGIQVKAASAKMSVPTYPPDNFESIFKMPEIKASDSGKIVVEGTTESLKEFFDAMGYAAECVASDATVPEQLGVTLVPAGKTAMSLYATNEKCLFYTRIKIKNPLAKRLTLSAEFVKQMLALRKRADTCSLYIHDNSAVFKAGTYMLFGKLIFSDRPLDFDGVLKQHFPDLGNKPKMSEVPAKLRMVLERASIVLGSDNDTEATAKDGKISFLSKHGDNQVWDVMLAKNQADLKIKFSPTVAKLAMDAELDQMRFTEKCVIFTNGELVLLVTAKV